MTTQTRLILPDLHIPFHDKACVRKWLWHAEQLKPDAVDVIGDLIDAYPLSSFDQNPERRASLQSELDAAADFLVELRSRIPATSPIHYSEGNHEQRLRRLLWSKCSAFAGLRGLTIPELLSEAGANFKDLQITWHPWGKPYRVGPLYIIHGKKLRKHSGGSARTTSDSAEGSVLLGHCHRMGWSPTTSWSGVRDAWEVGHLADESKLDWVDSPQQWQKGWAVLHVNKSWADVSFVRVLPSPRGRRFIYQGGEL